MTNKDIKKYCLGTFQGSMKSVTLISDTGKKDKKGNPISLVNSDTHIFDFDDISAQIYQDTNKNNPASLDGIFFTEDTIYMVEFKSGFKQKITRNNYKKEAMICPRFEDKCPITKVICKKTNLCTPDKIYCDDVGDNCIRYAEYCDSYGQLFLELQDVKKEELKTSLRMKTIESYITLEKKIFPLCNDLAEQKRYKLKLIIVIDGNSDDAMIASLEQLSTRKTNDKNNDFDIIKQSLSSYERNKSFDNCDYYYDEIKVQSPSEFKKFIESTLKHSR